MNVQKNKQKKGEVTMKLNIPAIIDFIDEKYRGNKSFFADEINIDRAYLTQILNKKKKDNSSKVCNNIIAYCERNNINYKRFIFL